MRLEQVSKEKSFGFFNLSVLNTELPILLLLIVCNQQGKKLYFSQTIFRVDLRNPKTPELASETGMSNKGFRNNFQDLHCLGTTKCGKTIHDK